MKLNYDGAKKCTTFTSLGFVIRDKKGELKLAGAKAFYLDASILFAETSALREVVKCDLALGYKNGSLKGTFWWSSTP